MIIVVSGLPRSGTSMMMKMLRAAGLPLLTDKVRGRDEDNPEGYYEDERAKKLHKDSSWIEEAEGKAVKVISYQLPHLPSDREYRVIFLRRSIKEVLASQRKMMHRRSETPDTVPDEVMASVFRKHLKETERWLRDQHNIKTLYVSYNETVADPKETAEQVVGFLELPLDVKKMMQAVNPSLYRQRKQP